MLFLNELERPSLFESKESKWFWSVPAERLQTRWANASDRRCWRKPGGNVKKLFLSVADDEAKEARAFVMAITFQFSLTLAGNTRSLPKKEASERSSNRIGSGLALKFLRPDWKGWPRANPLNILGLVFSNGGKKSFVTLTPGCNVRKLFFFVTDDKAK